MKLTYACMLGPGLILDMLPPSYDGGALSPNVFGLGESDRPSLGWSILAS